jgi:outer membrane cobalamin receptor
MSCTRKRRSANERLAWAADPDRRAQCLWVPDSGIYTNTLDVMLEDVDCIEVIRSVGATLWGANAMNGVINIITRAKRDAPELPDNSSAHDGWTKVQAAFRSAARPKLGSEVGQIG